MSEQKKIKISVTNDSEMKLFHIRDDSHIIIGATRTQKSARAEVPLEVGDSANWREKVHSVKERNLIALKNSILTDITLEVGPENTPFQAHKLILALGSPVFEAMFYGPLAEKGEKVTIPDIMPDGFKVLLRFLYGDSVVLNNEVEALNAWIASDKYCVPKLKKECDFFFSNCPMSTSNVWKLLENAVFLGLMPLVSRCKHYIENHTELSLLDEGFLETKTETIKHILNISSANVSELILLKSVIHWGKHKVTTEEAASLTEVLKPLLPHFRFGALSASDFCLFLEETGDLLEQSDALAILKHATKPLLYPLPEWCCTTNWERCSSSASYSKAYSKVYSRGLRLNEILDQAQKRREAKKYKKHKHSSHAKNLGDP